jgi:hypothetical protein
MQITVPIYPCTRDPLSPEILEVVPVFGLTELIDTGPILQSWNKAELNTTEVDVGKHEWDLLQFHEINLSHRLSSGTRFSPQWFIKIYLASMVQRFILNHLLAV